MCRVPVSNKSATFIFKMTNHSPTSAKNSAVRTVGSLNRASGGGGGGERSVGCMIKM
jgi:hypothetical protein